jgi:hypothetical protein
MWKMCSFHYTLFNKIMHDHTQQEWSKRDFYLPVEVSIYYTYCTLYCLPAENVVTTVLLVLQQRERLRSKFYFVQKCNCK